jgi:hypothetical protein
MGVTDALRGWLWKATPSLSAARTAQLNGQNPGFLGVAWTARRPDLERQI